MFASSHVVENRKYLCIDTVQVRRSKKVPLRKFFEKAVEELVHLENYGIEISTKSGPVCLYFLLAGVIGDNLAVHSLLGLEVRGLEVLLQIIPAGFA